MIILVMIEGKGEDAWRERNDARNDATETARIMQR